MTVKIKNQLLLFLLVPALPLLYLLLDQRGLYLFRDISLVYLPAKKFWADSVLHFHTIPGWNPYLYGGMPFLADMNLGPLHPLNFLFLLFSPYSAFVLFLLCHVMIFVGGVYWFTKEYKFGKTGSILATLSLTLSAFYFSTFSLLNVCGAITAIPFFLVFLRRAQKKWTLASVAGLAVALCWPIYAGDPQIAYGMCLCLLAVFISAIMQKRNFVAWQILAASALATFLSLAQVLPALGVIADSARGFGRLSPDSAQLYSFHPARIVEFFLTLPFGNLGEEYWGDRFLSVGNVTPFFFHVYLGAFGALAFIVLLFRFIIRRKKRGRKILTALMLALLVAFGQFSKINIYHLFFILLPGWNFFRYPERWLIVSVFLALIFTAPAFRWIGFKLAAKPKKKNRWSLFFFISLAMAGAFFFLSWKVPVIPWRSLVYGSSHLFFILALFCALFAYRKKIKSIKTRQAILCLIFVVDLLPVSVSLLWRAEIGQVPMAQNPIAQKIQAYKSTHETDFQSGAARRYFHGTYAGIYPLQTTNSFLLGLATDWATLYPNISMYYLLESASGYGSFDPQNIMQLWREHGKVNAKRLLDLFSVSFLAARSSEGVPEVRLNSSAAPMIFTPPRIWHFRERAAAEEKLFAADFNPADSVVLMGESGNQNQSAWQVVSYDRTPDSMRAELRDWNGAAEKITVVWNERFNKNWRAFFNGVELPVQEANLWSMAVSSKVPAKQGVQVLEFRYSDPAFPIGRNISIAACVCVLLLCLPWRRLKKNRAT